PETIRPDVPSETAYKSAADRLRARLGAPAPATAAAPTEPAPPPAPAPHPNLSVRKAPAAERLQGEPYVQAAEAGAQEARTVVESIETGDIFIDETGARWRITALHNRSGKKTGKFWRMITHEDAETAIATPEDERGVVNFD